MPVVLHIQINVYSSLLRMIKKYPQKTISKGKGLKLTMRKGDCDDFQG